jgi:hypothetical protein
MRYFDSRDTKLTVHQARRAGTYVQRQKPTCSQPRVQNLPLSAPEFVEAVNLLLYASHAAD